MKTYQEFLGNKSLAASFEGIEANPESLNEHLFDFQRYTVSHSLKLGRSAIFANTGLGKTIMETSWAFEVAQHTSKPAIVFAPLAVARQTVREASKFGIDVNYCNSQADVKAGINISNYEKLHKFNPDAFAGIVLDESSLIKHSGSQSFNLLTEFARLIPFRLCCTATPAPNDFMEFGCHAEFLGVMSRVEMLSTFFKHDGGETSKWRLKKHAESEFWKWLCGWAIAFKMPSDLGFSDDGYILPPLVDYAHQVEGRLEPVEGELVAIVRNMNDRRKARKLSLSDRVQIAADLANSSDEPWMIWCDLNDEGDALEKLIPGSVQVCGSDSPEFKEKSMLDFADGSIRVLISKPSICGAGMNWQHCRNVCFVGINDSWESMYQATNRFHRFGQTQQVNRHLIYSAHEHVVLENLKRKQSQADAMWRSMAKYVQQFSGVVAPTKRQVAGYNPKIEMTIPEWLISEVA